MCTMKIPKPADEDKDYFRSIVPEAPGVETKPMFGNLAGFVNGNMFIGLFGSDIGLRLAERDRAILLTESGSGSFGPSERPMKEYVTMPTRWRREPTLTTDWVDRALSHTSDLPPKKKTKKT
jgi:TfoX/Sxy family transcriptional regulator of competence genes